MTRTMRTLVIALGGLLLAACGGGGSGSPDDNGGTDTKADATLAPVADCHELLAFAHADARSKIAVQARELRDQGWIYALDHTPYEPAPFLTFAPLPAPTPAAAAGAPTRDFTDTNVQVPGVDEPDVVETDGDRLYLLEYADLLVLDASPPEDTALIEQIPIEGGTSGMFVAGQRALVLSQVYDSGNLGGGDACRVMGGPFPLPFHVDGPVPATDVMPPTCPSPFVKITLLDLSAGAARTVREIYLEGSYLSARRQGKNIRVIAQRGWGWPSQVPDPWQTIWLPTPPASAAELDARVDAWEAAALAAIDASALADWLPVERERIAGTLVDRPLGCENARVPAPGLAPEGSSIVLALDMSVDDAPLQNTLLMGGASQVYAGGETLVLAGDDWSPVPVDDATSRTVLHVLDFPPDSLATVYRGSGTVPGSLLSQFSIDVRDDVLRIATTLTKRDDASIVNRITTARIQDGALATIGASSDLAPGERIFGVRFLGDLAYLVTFRQIDPLFVVDLSDPAHPTVLGEVELPGFSEYLHPLGDHHLLTLGRAADASGQQLGVALRIFDVADPTAPHLTAEHVLAGDGWTPAAANHLAFTFDARLGILALPFNRYQGSALHGSLLMIDVDAVTGFEVRGEIDHHEPEIVACAPPFDLESCANYVPMQRGLFIDDAVYSLSTRQLQVHKLDDLDTPVARVALP